jgi:hypothetical protein
MRRDLKPGRRTYAICLQQRRRAIHVAEQEHSQINELVAGAEAKSGAQVLIAIAKAVAYPEIPWKASPSAPRSPP